MEPFPEADKNEIIRKESSEIIDFGGLFSWFAAIISGRLFGGNQFLQLKCFVNISLYLQLTHKNRCNRI